jgi:hypothetical protein
MGESVCDAAEPWPHGSRGDRAQLWRRPGNGVGNGTLARAKAEQAAWRADVVVATWRSHGGSMSPSGGFGFDPRVADG